ncbi:MAG: hypothetical protein MUF15_03800 [Acidobacteria bacterium]|nr:hypothetical protein [Acidobacteriota bacterium]
MEMKMEITGEPAETLESLSKVNVDFIEFVKKNPGSLKSTNFKLLETTRYAYKLQGWPTFINPQTKALFLEMGVKVFELIKSVPSRLFANDAKQIAAYLEQPETVVNLQLEGVTGGQLAGMVGRMDFTYSTTGLKCLEFNITVGTSGWQLPEWESLYLNTPIIDKFLKEYHVKINNKNYPELFLEHFVRFALRRAALPGLNVFVAVPDYVEGQSLQEYLIQLYNAILARKHLTGHLFIGDYSHLECVDNKIYFNGHRIYGVIELFHGFLTQGVRQAYNSGNICLMNGPITGLLSNKLILALLSENEESGVFSGEEKETIRKYIPWTRKIIPGVTFYKGEKISMAQFLIANKDKLVIKPSIGLGGQRVTIGQDTFRKDWELLVNIALRKKNYLVQELVEPPRVLYRVGEDGCDYHDVVWGAWVLGSQYGASFVRVVPGGNARKVVNGTQGAEISVVFEVDE